MNSATAGLELYHTLVRAGLPEAEADTIAKQVFTREEADDLLVTKTLLRDELHASTKWLVGVFIGIAFAQLGITVTVMTLLLNFHLS